MAGFAPGTVVQLKSGGPLMTVQEPHDEGKLLCMYFDKNNEPKYTVVHPVMLKEVP